MACELEATGGTKSVDGVLLRNVPVRFRSYLDRKDAKQRLQRGRAAAWDTLGEVGLRAQNVTDHAQAVLPASVTGRVSKLARTARQRPVPAVALVLGPVLLLVLRALLSRSR